MTATVLRRKPLVGLQRGTVCAGCGLTLPLHDGPTHAYMGASPACWALYRGLPTPSCAREEGARLRRLIQDTYAVQHPGVPQRRSLQSVAVHLMGLCVLLERDGEERRLVPVLGRMPARKTLDLHWLTPPEPNGTLTIADATGGGVEVWALDVWTAWAPHHATVRGWLDAPCLHAAG